MEVTVTISSSALLITHPYKHTDTPDRHTRILLQITPQTAIHVYDIILIFAVAVDPATPPFQFQSPSTQPPIQMPFRPPPHLRTVRIRNLNGLQRVQARWPAYYRT